MLLPIVDFRVHFLRVIFKSKIVNYPMKIYIPVHGSAVINTEQFLFYRKNNKRTFDEAIFL